MAAARRDELSAAEHAAHHAAEARVLEAQRRAEDLALAARRDAAEILRRQLADDSGSAWTDADEEWLEAEDDVLQRDVTEAHEQFWREEAQATIARTSGVSPVEVLLPTAALLILLLAVLLLIG